MADNYHLIDSSSQTVNGTAINELYEIKPSANKLDNLFITTGGGNDTIKIVDSNAVGLTATVQGFTSDCVFDTGSANYGTLLYKNQSDGVLLTDTNNKLSIKFQNYTGTFSNATLTTFTSSYERESIYGTDYDDEITVNHPRTTVDAGRYGYSGSGNDTVTVNTDNNFIRLGWDADVGILHGNNNTIAGSKSSYSVSRGNDTLISDGNNNYLYDGENWNMFISGGDDSTLIGGEGYDTFAVYSYGSSADVTITGGGNNDSYIFSTGLSSVKATDVLTANYNSSNNDTLNVTITDLDSLDSIYIRNKDMTSINHDIAAEGMYINDNTGRINFFLPNQRDWDAVKNTTITFEDMKGNTGTLTLEQAVNLPIIYPPAGVNVEGYNITVTSDFNGDLWMLDGYEGTNYNNQNIRDIDATQNPNTLIIAANVQSNYIKAGSGQTSLWGGTGGYDTLESGGNQTMFWYGKNDGNDVIINAHDYDTINLYDVNLSDVTSFNISEGSYSIGFNTGNFLTVYDKNSLTPAMQLADGSRYAYNRTTGSW